LLTAARAPAGAPPLADAVQPAEIVSPALSLEQLACMNWGELEQLYRQGNGGTIPNGYLRGRAIYCPDVFLAPAKSKMSQAMWHGKLFCPEEGIMINRWGMGVTAVKAKVCHGTSWLDGGPSVIMDYRGMSAVVWHNSRDEIREVAPGLYVGIMYRCKHGQSTLKTFFALELTPACQ
jgi:hypothetical protein